MLAIVLSVSPPYYFCTHTETASWPLKPASPCGISPNFDLGTVLHVNGNVVSCGDDRIFNVGQGGKPAQTMDKEFLILFRNDSSGEVAITFLDRLLHLSNGDSVMMKHFRLQIDLILADESAQVDHEGHPLRHPTAGNGWSSRQWCGAPSG